MSMGRQAWLSWTALLLTMGCGGNAETTEVASGNTNWLKECVSDDECGELSCACGTCRYECEGAIDCSLEPERACLGGGGAPQAEAPEVAFEDLNPDAYANDLVVDADGAIVLVGGTDFTSFDLSPIYPTFWLAKLDRAGNRLWQYDEAPAPDSGESATGLSVALSGDEIVALTTIYDGLDTPALRSFDAEGTLVDSWSSSPGFTRLASAPGGDLFAAGSRLNETRAGRPFSSAWVGRLGGDAMVWEQAREGLDGSISDVDVLVADRAGQLLVGGSLGTEPDSNASVPWLARLDPDGAFLWEESLAVPEVSNCNVTAVAFTADGGSLASASCVGPWLRAYDESGEVRWERRFAGPVTALAGIADGGYAVALGQLDIYGGAAGATLLRYDAEHQLLWRAEQSGCYRFERLVATEQGVLALAGCDTGYRLTAYVDP